MDIEELTKFIYENKIPNNENKKQNWLNKLNKHVDAVYLHISKFDSGNKTFEGYNPTLK